MRSLMRPLTNRQEQQSGRRPNKRALGAFSSERTPWQTDATAEGRTSVRHVASTNEKQANGTGTSEALNAGSHNWPGSEGELQTDGRAAGELRLGESDRFAGGTIGAVRGCHVCAVQ